MFYPKGANEDTRTQSQTFPFIMLVGAIEVQDIYVRKVEIYNLCTPYTYIIHTSRLYS